MVLGVLLLMGWRDKLNPRLERLYYGVFTILTYVSNPIASACAQVHNARMSECAHQLASR